jgi:hypothetical protein
VGHLDRFLGGTWWQALFASIRDEGDEVRATDVALEVSDRYCQQVARDRGYDSVSMPIRPRPDLLPRYVLSLFTRNTEGVWCFADSLGKAGLEWVTAYKDENTHKWWDSAVAIGQYTLFGDEFPAFDAETYYEESEPEWIKEIAVNIKALLAKRGAVYLADHVPAVYGKTLGSASIPHVRKAVKALHRDGLISNDGKGAFHKKRTVSLVSLG